MVKNLKELKCSFQSCSELPSPPPVISYPFSGATNVIRLLYILLEVAFAYTSKYI